MALSSGDLLGTYEIRALLGVGGIGEVYRAHDRKLGREVAIKVLPEEFSQDSERLARFKREAQLLAALNHPNIAAIYGLEESGATLYLVLELVPGETLAARLSKGRLSVEEALRIATQIAEALEEAHEKAIIHRDLKPGNVMITEDGKIKVLDFGLARAFAEDAAEADTSLSLAWVDRQGERKRLTLPPGLYRGARISPDGTSLATVLDDDIWLHDITRGAMSRLTFTADNSRAFWTPDGKAIVFASQRNGTDHVFWQPADGSSEAEQLTTGELDRHPEAISPDGSAIVFHEHSPDNLTDLWVLEMDGERETRLFLDTEFYERFAEVSPDGRWLAYVSDESGQHEVQVRPFPDGGGKTIVSTNGGSSPLWSADGHELFYREGRRVMAVPVELGDELTVGTPTFLFESSFTDRVFGSASLDVTADGERFIVVESKSQARAELHVVLNWFEELERLVPTN